MEHWVWECMFDWTCYLKGVWVKGSVMAKTSKFDKSQPVCMWWRMHRSCGLVILLLSWGKETVYTKSSLYWLNRISSGISIVGRITLERREWKNVVKEMWWVNDVLAVDDPDGGFWSLDLNTWKGGNNFGPHVAYIEMCVCWDRRVNWYFIHPCDKSWSYRKVMQANKKSYLQASLWGDYVVIINQHSLKRIYCVRLIV